MTRPCAHPPGTEPCSGDEDTCHHVAEAVADYEAFTRDHGGVDPDTFAKEQRRGR